MTLACRWCSLS